MVSNIPRTEQQQLAIFDNALIEAHRQDRIDLIVYLLDAMLETRVITASDPTIASRLRMEKVSLKIAAALVATGCIEAGSDVNRVWETVNKTLLQAIVDFADIGDIAQLKGAIEND